MFECSINASMVSHDVGHRSAYVWCVLVAVKRCVNTYKYTRIKTRYAKLDYSVVALNHF